MDILNKYADTVERLKKIWKEYGRRDSLFIRQILSNIPISKRRIFDNAVKQLLTHGITSLHNIFDNVTVENMMDDYNKILKCKKDGHHISFDGNTGETYLSQSLFLSEATVNSTIRNIIEVYFGQPVNFAYEKMYTDESVANYSERAYKPHHDGYCHVGVKVMILLSDVPPMTMGMQYCCGTQDYIHNTTRSQETQISIEYWNKLKKFDCCGKAGTVFIFNPNGIHSGQKNILEKMKRSVLVLNFQPGIFRNYYVSPLHPFIASSLTSYERHAYKLLNTPKIKLESDTNDDCYDKMKDYRYIQLKSYTTNDINVSEFDLISDSVFSERTTHNNNILQKEKPTYDLKIGSPQIMQKTINNIVSVTKEICKYDATRITKLEYVELNDIVKMIHNDLDLPIRMYGITEDMRRDNAITKMRDSPQFEKIKEMLRRQLNRFNESMYLLTFELDCNKLIDMLNIKRYTQDINTRQLCDDLIMMLLRTTNTIDTLMRTVLWSVLVLTKNEFVYIADYFDAVCFYIIWNQL